MRDPDDATQISVESQLAEIDVNYYTADVRDRLLYQVQLIQEALKHLVLVNGGAIVALFTLLGRDKITLHHGAIIVSFSGFGLGLLVTLIAWLAAIMSQERYAREGYNRLVAAKRRALGLAPSTHDDRFLKMGNAAFYICLACASSGVVAFLIGSAYALGGVM